MSLNSYECSCFYVSPERDCCVSGNIGQAFLMSRFPRTLYMFVVDFLSVTKKNPVDMSVARSWRGLGGWQDKHAGGAGNSPLTGSALEREYSSGYCSTAGWGYWSYIYFGTSKCHTDVIDKWLSISTWKGHQRLPVVDVSCPCTKWVGRMVGLSLSAWRQTLHSKQAPDRWRGMPFEV